MTALGGVLPRLIAAADGILTWDKIAPAIREKVYYRPQTALISLENTHNMAGGTVYPTEVAEEICERAHEAGISVHLDGARIFNAAVYLRRDVADITKKFDSVQFCLSKGLGAPVGSMIVGSKDFIERCRVIRKMLGGGMRQVGVLAGAGLVALEEGPKLLPTDHENAQIMAQGLARIPGIQIDPAKVQTNIVIFDVGRTKVVQEHPAVLLVALAPQRLEVLLLAEPALDLVDDGRDLALDGRRADEEHVGDGQVVGHVEGDDVLGQLLVGGLGRGDGQLDGTL